MQLARVGVRVIVVVCVMLVLIAHVVVHAVYVHSFRSHILKLEMYSLHYSAASRHEVLLDEDGFRSFLQALELGDVLLPLQLHVTVLLL